MTSDEISLAKAVAARRALNLPVRMNATAHRTSPKALQAQVSYTTPLGDMVKAHRDARMMVTAINALGLDPVTVRSIEFTPKTIRILRYGYVRWLTLDVAPSIVGMFAA